MVREGLPCRASAKGVPSRDVEGINFVAAAGLCLSVAADVGAASTQATINPTYGPRALRALTGGASAEQPVAALTSADAVRDFRQLHVVDRTGSAAAFTGAGCHVWSGHRLATVSA